MERRLPTFKPFDNQSQRERRLPTFKQTDSKVNGMMTYQLLEKHDQAIIDLTIKIDKQQFKQMMKQRNEKSMLVIMVDRSGSMSGTPIKAAYEACNNFGQNFFQKEDRNLELSTIFFNRACQVNENIPDLETYQQVLKKHCVASGGTLFVEPLTYLYKKIQTDKIHSVQVLFITDGDDNDKDATLKIVKEMKTFLSKNQILSRFNVMGIGAHESTLLSEMVNAGTDIGNHCYMQSDDKEFSTKMSKYIKNILNEAIWQKGIQVKLPDNRFVYISKGNEKEGEQYLLKRCQIIVNEVESPDVLTKIVVCQPFTDGIEISFKLQNHQIEAERLVIPKAIHSISQLNFATNDIQRHSIALSEIEEEFKSVVIQDDFDKIEQQRISSQVHIMQESIKSSINKDSYDDHSRAVMESARIEVLQRHEGLQLEVRVKKDSNVKKSALFLIYKALKNNETRIFIRALGRAIPTLDLIVNEFVSLGPKNYYNVDVTEEVDEFNKNLMKTVKLNIEKLCKPKVSFELLKTKNESQEELPQYSKQKLDKFLSKGHGIEATAEQWMIWITKNGVKQATYLLFNDQNALMFNSILETFKTNYPQYQTETSDERVFLTDQNTAVTKRIIKFYRPEVRRFQPRPPSMPYRSRGFKIQ